MSEANMPSGNESALKPDADSVVPRLQLGEQGVLGLKSRNGKIYEEAQAAFRYPAFVQTVNEMRNNPTVGAAMNVYRMFISRPKWKVVPPVGGTAKDIARANILQTMMTDMDQTWESFIESITPYLEYGFGINEKVYRRRLKRNGSKYNDGLIGIKKLPVRAQETISRWVFDPYTKDLLSVEQTLNTTEFGYLFQDKLTERGLLPIDRDKLMLFTASGVKGNPEGESIYKKIYLAFRQLSTLQNQELLGIAKDVQGILKIAIPPQYLDPNATPEIKAAAAAFQTIIDNYGAGTQRGLLVPNMIDPDSKLPMFTYEIMEQKGAAKYDTEKVITRLQNDILSALSVDILKLGANGAGSFSLAESKSSVLALAIDYRLREIRSVLNSDLIPSIYAANGWGCEVLPTFEYEDVEQIDLATFSAAIQRIAAVSMVEVDRPILNKIREALGVAPLAADEPVNKDALPVNMSGTSSASGTGMEVGTTGDGTRKNANNGQGDSSVSNKENAP